MTERLVCCAPGDAVSAAAKKMKDENIGPILVVEDEQGYQLVGIVPDRDLALKVIGEERDAQNTTVGDVMSREVVTCHADDALEKALNAMEEHQLRRIPVVDNDGRLVGIISQADVATRGGDPDKTAEVVKEISQPSH
jgi:CBS domain-containing protein